MKKVIFAVAVAFSIAAPLAHAGLFSPSDYAECLLANLPNTDNDVVARQLIAACFEEFPAGLPGVKARTGLFTKYPDQRSCVIKEAKSTKSPIAARLISAACYRLYEPSAINNP